MNSYQTASSHYDWWLPSVKWKQKVEHESLVTEKSFDFSPDQQYAATELQLDCFWIYALKCQICIACPLFNVVAPWHGFDSKSQIGDGKQLYVLLRGPWFSMGQGKKSSPYVRIDEQGNIMLVSDGKLSVPARLLHGTSWVLLPCGGWQWLVQTKVRWSILLSGNPGPFRRLSELVVSGRTRCIYRGQHPDDIGSWEIQVVCSSIGLWS
jgi:hypothetical protein